MPYRGRNRVSLAVITPLLAAACGGGSTAPAAPTPMSPAPAAPPTVTITSRGVNPVEIAVAAGGRVTFVNLDAVPHDVAGGPDPSTPDCPEIDAVGFLVPGQARQTAPFPAPRTCEYHDHGFHSPLFNGRIVIR